MYVKASNQKKFTGIDRASERVPFFTSYLQLALVHARNSRVKKGGVAALIRKDIPYLVDFHCLPHRLELALLEMQRSCKLVEEVYDVLNLVWKTCHLSAKSECDPKTLVNVLKPTQVTGTRWLPHVSRALKVFIKPGVSKTPDDTTGQYALVVYYIDHLSAS